MRRAAIMPILLAAAVIPGATGEARAADGASVYAEYCAACHDANGTGVPGIAPPLAGTLAARVKSPGGREYVAQVVVNGIAGTFESGGTRTPGTMSSFAALSDADLAAALNQVLLVFNRGLLPADFQPIAPTEIAAARTPPRSPRDLHRTKEALEKAAR
jgi:mono/diheme cytochrome c family protein